jgi:hypothetical protein
MITNHYNLIPPRIGGGAVLIDLVLSAVAVNKRLEPFLVIFLRFIQSPHLPKRNWPRYVAAAPIATQRALNHLFILSPQFLREPK